MNIKLYFEQINQRIKNINKYVENPINYKDINNPFRPKMPKTYVWVEDDK
jgi:hypothetical protein